MMLRAYCLYDRKSLAYHLPFFCTTDGLAVRMVSDLVADVNSNPGRHPNDFVLFYIGNYDDQKAGMHPISPLVHVIDCSALVKALQSEIPFPEKVTAQNLLEEGPHSANGREVR